MSKLLINKDGCKIREVELSNGSITIGRAKDNDIQLEDPTVSSHHAKIITAMLNSYIEDLASTNGVLVNGEPVVVQALQADDVISIGKHEIRFQGDVAEPPLRNRQFEDVHSVSAMTGSRISAARYVSATTDTLSSNAQDHAALASIDLGLRVVVDNTLTPVKQRPLDIDINFESFKNETKPGDVKSAGITIGTDAVNVKPYIDTYRYFERPLVTVDDENEIAGKLTNRSRTYTESANTQAFNTEVHTVTGSETMVVDEALKSSSEQAVKPRILSSRQPFMSSEEVVEQLIALGRARNKNAKKSGGFSALLGIIAFGLIAAAIYHQLQ
ncbi:FHA domain-containing protein [Kaarinaea lacus]